MAEPSLDAELHIKTTTIMFADAVELVRLIEQNELTAVTRIRALVSHFSVSVVPLNLPRFNGHFYDVEKGVRDEQREEEV